MYTPHRPGSGFPFVEFDISQTSAGAPVLCAWPLSGQYGVGSRYLYYALVLVSIFFLRTDWMRGAATAAALIYAAVAALHAIVLAVFSHKFAVDMDIFGAFQILAIGVLSAPITVRYSSVYWSTDGRNIIFLWTILVIAGLLSLVACFARATEQTCVDGSGNNITIADFTANMNSSDLGLCNLGCEAAFSPIRQDPQNPAQYILVPHKGMTLDTATLLCAACCIPALLSLIVMWQKVMRTNWQRLYAPNKPEEHTQPQVTAPSPMSSEDRTASDSRLRREEKRMDAIIKRGLNLVERIVYCVCILTIVVLGEENFWSPETRLGVEPVSSVGQWAPIVGAVFAALGSAYTSWLSPGLPDDARVDARTSDLGAIRLTESPRNMSEALPPDLPRPTLTRDRHRRRSSTLREEMNHHRQQIARGLERVVALTTPAIDRFTDDITMTHGHDQFRDYPLIPGEELRSDHWEEDVLRHRLITGRSRSVQSVASIISGASGSSHDPQDMRPGLVRGSSIARTESGGLLALPTWSLQSAGRGSPSSLFAPAEYSESAIEDDDAILMVNRSSGSPSSSPSSSPPIIVVTSDESP